jgi:hypothetical protein
LVALILAAATRFSLATIGAALLYDFRCASNDLCVVATTTFAFAFGGGRRILLEAVAVAFLNPGAAASVTPPSNLEAGVRSIDSFDLEGAK